ncbi:hypothetical protein [Rhizobium sp. 18055]|uniref:hypothetical protein n=1 Tax=Rhizobium sp. 18055 TaxID=2681403 RepID=UPI001359181E|nr:hypothetical protein [Rhizobium sp. 18055]
MKRIVALPSMTVAFLSLTLAGSALADQARFDSLANLPFEKNRPMVETVDTLKEDLLFQSATQTYLWALMPCRDAPSGISAKFFDQTWKPDDVMKVN